MPSVPKPKRYRNKKYLDHVRTYKCFCYANSEAHHLKTKGSGGSDLTSVPLCRQHHAEAHHIGREKFEAKHSIDLTAIQIECLESFIMQDYPVH